MFLHFSVGDLQFPSRKGELPRRKDALSASIWRRVGLCGHSVYYTLV